MTTYHECIKPITAGNRPGAPPPAFLDELFSVIAALPDEIFASNERPDLYSVLEPKLGPWKNALHRRAAMACALIVDAGFESGWNWNEGADTTAGYETPVEQETGAWQVSAKSSGYDVSLAHCLAAHAVPLSSAHFISAMKLNHALAVEYAARLFRVNTRWSGPCNRTWIARAVTPAAVAEIEALLGSSKASQL